MLKGILCLQYCSPDKHFLIFKCPGCNNEHGIDVKENSTGESNNILWWRMKILNQDKENKKALLEISPSFDASKVCGYHSHGIWNVEAHVLESNEYRDKISEEWLNS